GEGDGVAGEADPHRLRAIDCGRRKERQVLRAGHRTETTGHAACCGQDGIVGLLDKAAAGRRSNGKGTAAKRRRTARRDEVATPGGTD
ncbi:hypothetical protein ACQ9AQ_27865, partial [Escherichia coli]|uniref:hypothetical protein n=1 Tax=Escherichia coli TaxID=562 RepID=UPI003D36A906